ncbi:MAG TPA: cell division protein FtsZ, partial [Bacilli bacterium]|nr:cell division protein FtsZ [Bacilli bacterium]
SPLLEASIRGSRRAIVAVTCGPNVSLFDAQETVNLLIDASGHDIDVKFGVAINDQLNDEILVSVIASDFEDEVNFSAPQVVPPLTRPENSGAILMPEPAEEENAEKEKDKKQDDLSIDEDILPSFLKD